MRFCPLDIDERDEESRHCYFRTLEHVGYEICELCVLWAPARLLWSRWTTKSEVYGVYDDIYCILYNRGWVKEKQEERFDTDRRPPSKSWRLWVEELLESVQWGPRDWSGGRARTRRRWTWQRAITTSSWSWGDEKERMNEVRYINDSGHQDRRYRSHLTRHTIWTSPFRSARLTHSHSATLCGLRNSSLAGINSIAADSSPLHRLLTHISFTIEISIFLQRSNCILTIIPLLLSVLLFGFRITIFTDL